MSHMLKRPIRPPAAQRDAALDPSAVLVDFEADNIQLRAALADSVDEGIRRDLITRELTHRIGNVLAVVQAIARQTFSRADARDVERFSARLVALAAAQRFLIDSEVRAATLTEVIHGAIVAQDPDGGGFTFSGPELALDGRRAHALTLALHELSTNAAKHGALSVEGGWVEVTWTIAGGRLDFLWREHDGPQVVVPTSRGFGSLLIRQNLSVAFAGQVELSFMPAGLECRLSAAAQPDTTPAASCAGPHSATSGAQNDSTR